MNKIFVTRSSLPPFEEYIEEIKPLWDSRWLTNMGEKHKQLELKLCEYLGVPHISLTSNGHMGLELVLQAMGITGEVITTPFTFASTTHAIVRNRLEPVFCDINPDDFTIDVTKLESLITDKTTAILPVHVYGNLCNIEVIEKIAKKYSLKVIYDAAHAFGVRYKGTGIGNFGDASVFSFHATKVFHTIEGGAVSYQEEDTGKKLYRLKNFGIKDEITIEGIGANAKMNEFQAAMGLCNLKYIESLICVRKNLSEHYRNRLCDIEGIQLIKERDDVKYNYAYFPIVINEKLFGGTRNEIYEYLRENNIYARKYFYPLTNSFQCFQGKYDVSCTPTALYISKRILTLPLYPELTLNDIDSICDKILYIRK